MTKEQLFRKMVNKRIASINKEMKHIPKNTGDYEHENLLHTEQGKVEGLELALMVFDSVYGDPK